MESSSEKREQGKQCQRHEAHGHQHGPSCGHKSVTHGDHVDYEHDGHYHRMHGDHVDECSGPGPAAGAR